VTEKKGIGKTSRKKKKKKFVQSVSDLNAQTHTRLDERGKSHPRFTMEAANEEENKGRGLGMG